MRLILQASPDELEAHDAWDRLEKAIAGVRAVARQQLGPRQPADGEVHALRELRELTEEMYEKHVGGAVLSILRGAKP
jgi:hypothetical protein